MTRIAKLNARFLADAPPSFAEFQRLLEAYGFRLARISGSHHIYVHPRSRRPLPIVPDRAAARRYQMREARVMIEELGLMLDGE